MVPGSSDIAEENAENHLFVWTLGRIPMCLAIPMRIIGIEGFAARCEAKGVERTVSLLLLQYEELNVGDLVMVHHGRAIQTMTEDEAQASWALIDEMLAEEEHHALNRMIEGAATPLARSQS